MLQEGPRISVNCSIKQLDNDLDNESDKVMQSAWSKLRTEEIC